jgi:integrase
VSTSEISLAEHVERYLHVHPCSEARRRTLRSQLGAGSTSAEGSALEVFGQRMLRDLEGASGEIAEWAATIPNSARRAKVGALRQVLAAAVDWNRMLRNPAASISAPQVRPGEIAAFDDTEELDVVAAELNPPWSSLIVLASETGLRPEEWAALERRDIDKQASVILVQRSYTVDGGLKPYGKTSRSRRAVPLSDRALEALDQLPVSITTPILFPTYSAGTTNGAAGHLNLRNWRKRVWRPALRAAGLERDGKLWLPRPYALRHTFATWALEAGFDVFELARMMGTSAMIDRTYGHLARGHAERARERLNRRPSIVVGVASGNGPYLASEN